MLIFGNDSSMLVKQNVLKTDIYATGVGSQIKVQVKFNPLKISWTS